MSFKVSNVNYFAGPPFPSSFRKISAIDMDLGKGGHPLQVYELLEYILLYLPLNDLLLAQRVSNFFRSVIQDSTRIQQALFFKPVEEVAGRHQKSVQEHENAMQHHRDTLAKPTSLVLLKNMPISPFLCAHIWYTPCDGEPDHCAAFRTRPVGAVSKILDLPNEASLHKMLVLQPHGSSFTLYEDFQISTERSMENGLTLGEMIWFQKAMDERFASNVNTSKASSIWLKLSALQWDWRLCPGQRADNKDFTALRAKVRMVTGWEVLGGIKDAMR